MAITGKTEKKKLAILEVLKSSNEPLSGGKITESLNIAGYDISERTVRLYLQQLDEGGLTEPHGKKGRTITEEGRHEIGSSRLLERVGYMSARIDQMTFQMNFDLALRSGTVVVNTTLIDPLILVKYIKEIKRVFSMGYAMGHLIGVLKPGEKIGDMTIPEGQVGLCTVCSITLNGVLLKHGVPVRSLFCGLLELHDHKPVRLAEIINYDGTSLDPLELFIRGGRTNYMGAISSGSGYIGIGFRELPAESYDLVVNLAEKLEKIGLGAFMEIGRPGQALFGIPVPEGCIGAIVVGGLNPMAIYEENGIHVEARALSGLLPFNRLIHYEDLDSALKDIM
jgi:HTH-type transcriptional regulator, global nitrogen regulator NrpRI